MIKSIEIKNFKALKDNRFDFKEGVNIIEGENGIGKTTLLNSIFYISNRRMLYNRNYKTGFNKDSSFFDINLETDENRFSVQATKDRAEFYVNDELTRSDDYNSISPSVIFFDSRQVYDFQNYKSKRMKLIRRMYLPLEFELNRIYKEIENVKAELNSVMKSKHSVDTKIKLSKQMFIDLSRLQFKFIERERFILELMIENFEPMFEEKFKEKVTLKKESIFTALTAEEIFNFYKKDIKLYLNNFKKLPTILDDKLVFEGISLTHDFSKGQQRIIFTMLIISIATLTLFLDKNKTILLDDYFSELSEKSIIYLITLLKTTTTQIFITNPSINSKLIESISYKIEL